VGSGFFYPTFRQNPGILAIDMHPGRPIGLTLSLALLWLAPASAAANVAGTLFSGPTSADPAALYWNPAAMTLLGGSQIMLSGSISSLRLSYARDTPSAFDNLPLARADTHIPAPRATLGAVTSFGLENRRSRVRDLRFGLGLSFPMVDGASWGLTYGGRESSTRHYALQGKQVVFMIHAAVAYRVFRWLSLAVGADLVGLWLSQDVMTDFGARINQLSCEALGGSGCQLDVPLRRENPAYDGLTTVNGTGVSAGFAAGLLIEPLRWLRLGVGLHTGGFDVSVPVDITVEVPRIAADYIRTTFPSVRLPEVEAQGTVVFHTPMIVTAGVGVDPLPGLGLAVDFQWMNTSASATMFATISRTNTGLVGDQVLVSQKRDKVLVALRGSYRVIPALNLGLRLEYDANSRPGEFTTPVSLDYHKFSFHLGASWRVTRWLILDVEYAHFFLLDRTVRVSRFAPNAFPTTPEEESLDRPSPTGTYSGGADLFGLGMRFAF
jgi:long-subunit fatty acid transport protein